MTRETVQRIARGMLEAELVSEVLAFVRGLDDTDVVPAFLSRAAEAEGIVTAPVNPSSLAKLLADFGPRGKRIGVVVRACDGRGIVELAKRNQVDLDALYLVGVPCTGVTKVLSRPPEGEAAKDEGLEPSCRRCECLVPVMADVLVAAGPGPVRVNTDKGRRIAEAAKLEAAEGPLEAPGVPERAAAWQEKDFGALRKMSSRERLAFWNDQFRKCIKCFGCRNACPICSCEDCACAAGGALVRRGVFPPDRLFHLTRLMHVADSCVNCGQCEAACPMGIPTARLYHMLNKELSAAFGYASGMDAKTPPPLGTVTEQEKKLGGVDID